MSDLIAHDAREAIDAVGFFRALRHAPLRSETFWSITAGRDDRARGDDHARTGNDVLFDRLLQTNIGISSAFSAQIANRREAGEKRIAQMVGRASDTQTQRLARHLIVPDGFLYG